MSFINEYNKWIETALKTIDPKAFDAAEKLIEKNNSRKNPTIVFGNGGSAAIAEHFTCDHTKGVRHDTQSETAHVINKMRPNFHSLPSNVSLLTAIANDYGYEYVFSKQVEWFENKNALVIAISSSGSSPNIVNGLNVANRKGYDTIALVGFDGGTILREQLASTIVHVIFNNYGVVEDCHQIVMHALAQSISKNHQK